MSRPSRLRGAGPFRRYAAIGLLAALMLATGPAGAAAGDHPAVTLVKQTTEEMLSILRKRADELRQHPQRIYGVVHEVVLPHFDFVRMAQLVLGKYGRRASPEQRRRFVEEFRTLLVRTYATSLLEYSGQTVEYLPFRGDRGEDQVTVKTEIQQPDGPPIPVAYSLRRKNGEWKVYDVTVEGVSLVLNYRTSFAEQIQRFGMDGFLDRLAARNRESAPGEP